MRRQGKHDRNLETQNEETRYDDTRYDDTRRDGEVRETRAERRATGTENARERFGGVNTGAAFFGWLVAIGVTVLMASIVSAIAAAVGYNTNLTQNQAQRQAGAIGLAAAIALLVVLMIGYYAGGYVAGRMSRFDGARQGLAVWIIGLVITIIAVVIGLVFGDQYNVLDRVNLPRIPIPNSTATTGGIITGLAVLVGTALAAVAGGKVGQRYHTKVDRALRV
jgi:amino acid transporter